jgi:hypothetical protein
MKFPYLYGRFMKGAWIPGALDSVDFTELEKHLEKLARIFGNLSEVELGGYFKEGRWISVTLGSLAGL